MPVITSNQKQFNPQNERIKFEYRKHLCRIKRADEKTLKVVFQHIREFEELTGFQNFPQMTSNKISLYVDKLSKSAVSLSYLAHNIRALNQFFLWLQGEPDYRNK